MELNFKVKGGTIYWVDRYTTISSGSTDIICNFEFCDGRWDDFDVKTVIFKRDYIEDFSSQFIELTEEAEMENNTVLIPENIMKYPGIINLGIIGTKSEDEFEENKITTDVVKVPISPNIEDYGRYSTSF